MPANLVVVDLTEALARLDGGLSPEEEAEAKLLVEKTKLKTWDLEHAPVMTLEEVRAFRAGKPVEVQPRAQPADAAEAADDGDRGSAESVQKP